LLVPQFPCYSKSVNYRGVCSYNYTHSTSIDRVCEQQTVKNLLGSSLHKDSVYSLIPKIRVQTKSCLPKIPPNPGSDNLQINVSILQIKLKTRITLSCTFGGSI